MFLIPLPSITAVTKKRPPICGGLESGWEKDMFYHGTVISSIYSIYDPYN
jgi:hypothetical protein